MRRRNHIGQFIHENQVGIFEQIREFLNIISLFLRLFPFLLIAYVCYRYFDFSDIVTHIFIKLACGHSTCKCSCEEKKLNNGW